ncbi:MAG: DegT/DnrJ/EryC1/StrS family aminotransferase [Phycisphaerae bacterium]|nr:DegT/DnrJ/EryC1/StrS family aminotransferase [Phycisphaerae bacterium]
MSSEIPLSAPDITEAEVAAVVDALRSQRLSIGPRQVRFEELVAERCGCRHAVAVSSGTAGLHLTLLALGVGPGDEVITTPFSFIASANSILYCGATPVFVDIDPVTLNLDPDRTEAAITDRTKAILAVEAFGNPAGLDQVAAVAARNEVPLVEDACEAIGGRHRGRPVGGFGRAAVFGFYPNKQITTGEGGMIVTNDDRLADLARSLRNHGRPLARDPDSNAPNQGSWLAHERLGYNYRLSEVAAAIGMVQMERLDEILQKRQQVACLYFEKLMDMPELILPTISPETDMSWFVFVVRLTDTYGPKERDRIIRGLRRHEVGCSNYFPPIHLQPFYREALGHRPGDFPITESIAGRTIALPFHNGLDPTQVDLVSLTVQVMLQHESLLRPDTGS